MKKTFLVSCAVMCLVIIGGFRPVYSQKSDANGTFRYVIVDNRIDPSIANEDPERRFIEVLINRKSFSKKNLVRLFRLISDRFPNPGLLYVTVFSELNNVPTPEERDVPMVSNGGQAAGPIPTKPTARFVRLVDKSTRIIINFPKRAPQVVELR